jgi:HPt (histidine-containing phosphotransfer) domain-containing protein
MSAASEAAQDVRGASVPPIGRGRPGLSRSRCVRWTLLQRHGAPPSGTGRLAAMAGSDQGVAGQALLDEIGGDRELLVVLCGMFAEQSSELLAALHGALARRDVGAADEAAHALKGSIGTFSTGLAFVLAGAIEHAARSGDLGTARGLAPGLDVECAALRGAVARLAREEGRVRRSNETS